MDIISQDLHTIVPFTCKYSTIANFLETIDLEILREIIVHIVFDFLQIHLTFKAGKPSIIRKWMSYCVLNIYWKCTKTHIHIPYYNCTLKVLNNHCN